MSCVKSVTPVHEALSECLIHAGHCSSAWGRSLRYRADERRSDPTVSQHGSWATARAQAWSTSFASQPSRNSLTNEKTDLETRTYDVTLTKIGKGRGLGRCQGVEA